MSVKRHGDNENRLVMGKRAVRELLRAAPERIASVWYAGKAELPEGEMGELIARHGLRVKRLSPAELTAELGSDSHQSIAAMLTDRRLVSLADLLQSGDGREEMLVVVLDGLEDPHNFGAVMRAAECFGAAAVIWSRNRGTGITPVVAKASAGASEILDLVPVSNLADALRKLKDKGFWTVAAAVGEDCVPLPAFERPRKLALVLGAEGRGISQLLLREADFRVKIPMLGRVEALNVSQAASVMLYALQLAKEDAAFSV